MGAIKDAVCNPVKKPEKTTKKQPAKTTKKKPSNALKDFGANAHSRPGTLKLCQGDCDNDSHCDKGLKCFQRSGTTAVPGCTGKGVTNRDYCITPPKATKPAIKDFGA